MLMCLERRVLTTIVSALSSKRSSITSNPNFTDDEEYLLS